MRPEVDRKAPRRWACGERRVYAASWAEACGKLGTSEGVYELALADERIVVQDGRAAPGV